MDRILTVIVVLLLYLELPAQTERKFDYSSSEFSSFMVKPLFDQSKPEGKLGRGTWTDQKYINELFNKPIQEVLTKDTQDSLSLGTGFIIAFNIKGEIINCKFILSYKDSTLISENDLYELYLRFKEIKIDMSKVEIVLDYNIDGKEPDYAFIGGSMISQESRDRINNTRRIGKVPTP